MPEPTSRTRLDRFARIAQIAQGLSIIIGIAVAVANIYTSRESAAFSLRNMRLSSLQHIGTVIKEDGEVQQQITALRASRPSRPSPRCSQNTTAGRATYISRRS